MILVTHAYSRVNAGDGLLLDLTLDRLSAIGIPMSDITVAALDPASFSDLPRVVKSGTGGRSVDRELGRALIGAATLAVSRSHLVAGELARAFSEASGFVAVGGGYLRTGSRVNRAGTFVNHLPQLVAETRSGRPSIFLPQSIGPLTGWQGAWIRSRLHRASVVHVRDDRSLRELGTGAGIRRTPDLAVLALADRAPAMVRQSAGGLPIVVARRLERPGNYPIGLSDLAHRLGEVRWGVQTLGPSTKSDRAFYEEDLGVEPDGRAEELVAGPDPGPVISVRLHGSLQAILAGVPAIHLGYERKSWGAYSDLGLQEWLHPARTFDPLLVVDQVCELRKDPSRFWACVDKALPRLRTESARLTESIADHLTI